MHPNVAATVRLMLVTDDAFEDAGDVARWLPHLGVELEVRQTETASYFNRALAELEAPNSEAERRTASVSGV